MSYGFDPGDVEGTSPCASLCPPKFDVPPAKGAGPPPQPRHLPKMYWEDYRAWARFPNAPYPPGGTPSGGAQELSISSEEWALRARQSPCRKCEFEQQVKEASRLSFQDNKLFWAGVGMGALGIVMLVVMKGR